MNNPVKIVLVCSSGGHLFQLFRLQDCFKDHPRFWVTFPTDDAKMILKSEKIYWAFYPTNRNLKNFIKNLFLAAKIIVREKPTYLVSTGAGVGVSFIYMARLLGVKTIYIESMTRIEDLSLSGRLVYFIAHHFLVQWEDLPKKYKRAVYAGRVI